MLKSEIISDLIAIDQHWRAKEILQGRLSEPRYNPELFESYGYVLLKMHDDIEAGKYLFLSGVRNPEYQKAISLFTGKYGKENIQHIYHTFPKAAQASAFADYPATVIKELEELGYKPRETKKVLERAPYSQTVWNKILGYLAISVVLVLLAGLVTMAVRGLAFLWELVAK